MYLCIRHIRQNIVVLTIERYEKGSLKGTIRITKVLEVFLEPRSGEDESRSGEKRKTSGYLELESHFHAHARVRI